MGCCGSASPNYVPAPTPFSAKQPGWSVTIHDGDTHRVVTWPTGVEANAFATAQRLHLGRMRAPGTWSVDVVENIAPNT